MSDNFELFTRKGKIIPVKKTLSEQLSSSIFMLLISLFCLIIFATIFFLYDSTQIFQKGYILQLEQQKKDQLLQERELFTNKSIEFQSTKTLLNHPLIKSMQKPEKILYINK